MNASPAGITTEAPPRPIRQSQMDPDDFALESGTEFCPDPWHFADLAVHDKFVILPSPSYDRYLIAGRLLMKTSRQMAIFLDDADTWGVPAMTMVAKIST